MVSDRKVSPRTWVVGLRDLGRSAEAPFGLAEVRAAARVAVPAVSGEAVDASLKEGSFAEEEEVAAVAGEEAVDAWAARP